MSGLVRSQRQFPRGDGKRCFKEDQESAVGEGQRVWGQRGVCRQVDEGVRKCSIIWELQTTH